MMTSQISKSVDFTKTQKSRYLENETLFFLQIKRIINYTSRATLLHKNSFVAEETFKHLAVRASTARFLKYVWSFFKIMHERVNLKRYTVHLSISNVHFLYIQKCLLTRVHKYCCTEN